MKKNKLIKLNKIFENKKTFALGNDGGPHDADAVPGQRVLGDSRGAAGIPEQHKIHGRRRPGPPRGGRTRLG